MKTILNKAENRGFADHGWLKAAHSFSFANYHNPQKLHFGVLRVLNDDQIAAGMGFGTHPHANMEIITIPLSGELHHRDSMENFGAIKKGEIQVMSAGTGIEHSEFNGSETEDLKLLQIWVIPNKNGVQPRYEDVKITENTSNSFQQIISPNKEDEGSWIHQDAWFNLANFDANFSKEYEIKKPGNGVYIFVIEGEIEIDNTIISKRDALEITETESFSIIAKENSEFLIIDVPMNLPKI